MAKISLFQSRTEPVPIGEMDILTFYNMIINGDYKNEIDEIRAGNIEMKLQLPAVTLSGYFSYRHFSKLINHSGRICIDIDGKDNPDITSWPDLRYTIGTWGEVEFCSLSASGNGVFCVVSIAYPNRHLEQWLSLEQSFKREGIKIDTSGKDIARLRFMSYDPQAIYNDDVKLFRGLFKQRKAANVEFGDSNTDELVKKIVQEGINIADSYHDWFVVGCALSNEFGERGRVYFHSISSISSKYSQRECDKKYDNCLKTSGKITAGTLYYLYRINKP
jgi:hypothetical protein